MKKNGLNLADCILLVKFVRSIYYTLTSIKMQREKERMFSFKSALFFKICFVIIFFGSYHIKAQNVELKIHGLRSVKGSILIGIFKDHESYKKEIPYKFLKYDKKGALSGCMNLKFDLDEGIYGVTLLDDENDNGKMDYNYIGIPKEGFGFWDYYLKGLTKPHFDTFKQEVLKNQVNKFEIRVKYI